MWIFRFSGWHAGFQVFRLACRFSGFQVFRFSGWQAGLQVFRFSGFQVFRLAGFQVFRMAGFQVFSFDVFVLYVGIVCCRTSLCQRLGSWQGITKDIPDV